jgi:hypothetical protein
MMMATHELVTDVIIRSAAIGACVGAVVGSITGIIAHGLMRLLLGARSEADAERASLTGDAK